ncbi:MAG: phospholipase D-like domain-containing protein [Candidatus Bathyarchaeia archaeon]|jgi:hypothetical protein
MQSILYTSGEVREAIVNLFEAASGRKVAISAFVGDGADAYLGKVSGLELICWPKSGGTNPHALRRLISKGAKISFSDSLHMKVYWAENQSAVITSANLSTNALGSGNLKEIGVLLKAQDVDIQRVIDSLKTRPVTEKEIRKLEREHKDYVSRNPSQNPKDSEIQSYYEWYASFGRSDWKLGEIEGECGVSQAVRDRLKKDYGLQYSDNQQTLISAPKGCYKKTDWVLTFFRENLSRIEWLYVDFVADVSKSDREYDPKNPSQVVQVRPRKYYNGFPFDEKDKRFKKAFSAAIKEYGIQKIDKMQTSKPPKKLVEAILRHFQK